LIRVLRQRLAPLAGAAAVSTLEARVEQAQVIEAALLRDIDYFDIGITQQRDCFHEAHFHPQGGNRQAKVLMKEAT